MTPLSKTAEKKLIAAIEKAAEYVNAGLSPNAAIIKSAGETNVPAGHVNLMVHAYNTGRTTRQREQGDNMLEKAADFNLADAHTVLKALYPDEVKTSADLRAETVVSTDYALSPKAAIARRNAELQKAAALKRPLPEKTYTPPPRDPKFEVQRAHSEKMAAFRAAEETRRAAFMAQQKAAQQLDAVADYFRRPGNMPFQSARREVELRFGATGLSVLDKVAEVYPHFAKQADDSKTYFGEHAIYQLVQDTLQKVGEYLDLSAAVMPSKTAQFEKKKAPEILTESILTALEEPPLTLKEAYEPTGAGLWSRGAAAGPRSAVLDRMFPPPAPAAAETGGDAEPEADSPPSFWSNPILSARSTLTDPKPTAKNPPRNFFNTVGHFAVGPEKRKEREPSSTDFYDSLSAPDHEIELDNIQMRGMLHDLMINDDVISGHDPREVAMAFNDIASVAPEILKSPGAMQAILRKRLEAGQMADFDVKQLMDMEKIKHEMNKLHLEGLRFEKDLVQPRGGEPRPGGRR